MYGERKDSVHIRQDPGLRFFDVQLAEPRWYVQLSKQEIATIERAIAIRERVRDELRQQMGWDRFEYSDYYTLDCDDLLDGPIEFYPGTAASPDPVLERGW